MKPEKTIESDGNTLEVVVGVFENLADASRVAASMRRPELKVQRVSRRDPAVANEMPDIVYDEVTEDSESVVADGVLKGGAIGAGSGLLFLGVPGFNIAAPIAGALTGAWIGGIAALDESRRGQRLPNEEDYQRMLESGKSFVVIAGDETTRIEIGNEMEKLGAAEIHQHPPVLQAIRHSED